MKKLHALTVLAILLLPWAPCLGQTAPTIPLPEHPRPDFERPSWMNLNGPWSFRFDKGDVGESGNWQTQPTFDKSILVPFPWGSPLSGVENEADIAWYARKIKVPESWKGSRVFLVVGASDWVTSGWLDGKKIGQNREGIHLSNSS